MAYLDKVLQPGEKILHRGTVSWTLYIPGLVLLIVALVAFGVVHSMVTEQIWALVVLVVLGVPALYLCATEDHARSASAFEAAGMGVSLGLAQTVRDDAIAKAVWALLTDSERRRQMRAAGLMTMDGTAAARIAGDLAGALTAKRNLRKAQTAR